MEVANSTFNTDTEAGAAVSRVTFDADGNVGIGTTSPDGRLDITGDVTANAWGVNGIQLQANSSTYTDDSTAASGTATNAAFNSFGTPTLAATNTSVTTTNAATVYIQGAPTAGANQTITNAYSLWVDDGASRFDGSVGINTEPTGYPLTVSRPSGGGYGGLVRLLPESGAGVIFSIESGGRLGLFSTAGEATSGIDTALGIGENHPDTNLQVKENNTDTLPTAEIEQLGTGDSGLQFSIPGDAFAIGIDNSDSDTFKISYAGAEGAAVLGTNDFFSLNTSGGATFYGDLTVVTGSQFTNASSTLFTSSAISNLPTGGNIGTAAATVDVITTFDVNQTTSGQTLTLPSPTDTTSGRIVFINNIGSASFTMYGNPIGSGSSASFIWNGTGWVQTISFTSTGVETVGSLDGQSKSADGAVINGTSIYLQTADATYPGLLSTGAQIIAGAKTFNGLTNLDGGIAVDTSNFTSMAQQEL